MKLPFFKRKNKKEEHKPNAVIDFNAPSVLRSSLYRAFSENSTDLGQQAPLYNGAPSLNANSLNANSFTPFPSRKSFSDASIFTKINAKNDVPDFIPYTMLDYLYQRHPVAKSICDTYPKYCWNPRPVILEINNKTGVPSSPFEKACAEIIKKVDLFEYIERVDRACQKGQYSVLYIDFNDRNNPKDGAKNTGQQTIDLMDGEVTTQAIPPYKWDSNFKNPTTGEELTLPKNQKEPIYAGCGPVDWDSLKGMGADAINYVVPYEQPNAWPTQYVVDYNRPSFALVNYYNLQSGGQVFGASSSINIIFGAALPVTWNVVHSSRCVHFIDNNIGNNIIGLPILYPCFNDLISLMRVSLGSATVFDLNARGGLAFSINTNKEQDSQSLTQEMVDAFKIQIDNYVANYNRVLTFENMDSKVLEFKVNAPDKHNESYIQNISAATGIPGRILVGNEAGRLASEQDKKNFDSRVKTRQEGFCTKQLKQFFDPLIAHKVVPAPTSGDYKVYFPTLDIPDDNAQAQNFNQVTVGLANLANAQSPEIENNMEYFTNEAMRLLKIDKNNVDLSVSPKDYRSPDVRADDLVAMFGEGGDVQEI